MVKFDKLLHGGDYNPEQWLDDPKIFEQDLVRMRQARINIVSVGIFSWAMLEPEEGVFKFDWLENVINRLYENGISVFLATPSGARPKWLADKYPEVLRVDNTGHRAFFGERHNHCYTSPVYREKVKIINQELVKRLGNHPAVKLWHISNEYGGACYCPLCQAEFRKWLKEKYGTIEELNRRWCTTFWSHRYNHFEQIEAPSPRGESGLHALNLDWKRFVTDRTADFIRHETEALREAGSTLPTTVNMMYYYEGLDYHKLAPYVDVVSWDCYPMWHKLDDGVIAADTGMYHDVIRSLKKQPFLLMESSPSSMNWQPVSKLKKPGVLHASSLQAVAHGSDSVLYFQIRQSQGASEKFHGAVIDHYSGSDTRVFHEVAKTGASLEALSELCGTEMKAQAAVLYDWESRWALEDSAGPRNQGMFYQDTVRKIYSALRKQGLNVDVINQSQPLDEYKIVAIPMLYMFKEGFAEKVREFVENGGTVLMTYWSGIVDETDRCFMEGTPHGLMDVFGLRSAEIDALYDWETNAAIPTDDQDVLTKSYVCKNLCELVEVAGAKSAVGLGDDLRMGCEEERVVLNELLTDEDFCDDCSSETMGVKVLAVYANDFYAGTPALTCNTYGKGKAYYISADFEQGFYDELVSSVAKETELILPPLEEIPHGMEVTERGSEEASYVIIQNFGEGEMELKVTNPAYQMIYGADEKILRRYETVVLKKHH